MKEIVPRMCFVVGGSGIPAGQGRIDINVIRKGWFGEM